MKPISKPIIAVFLMLTAGLSWAQELDNSALSKKLQSQVGLSISSIADAPVNGLVQVNTERGIFYATKDGSYFLQARIYNVNEGMRDETEAALTSVRLDGIQAFESDMIEFKAEDEKYVVSVFTDISCGYCRRLHEQIDTYNDAGITVRYLAFPRAGLKGKTYDDMVSVWCAKDPQKALTLAKAGDSIDSSKCANTIADQYRFGQKIGVNGTPNIVLPNGGIIPGYQPAPQLLQALQRAG